MAIKMHEHLFESSGITVKFRNISPMVAVDVRKSMGKLKPVPPFEMLSVAGAEPTKVVNEEDPDYVDALEKFEEEVQLAINEAYVKRAKFMFDDPDWQQEVAAYRADLIDNVPESDQWLYITRIISTNDELSKFYDAVNGVVRPDGGALAAVRDSFQSDVQGT